MRSAMARFLTVNDFSGSSPGLRGKQDLNLPPERSPTPDFAVPPVGSHFCASLP